MSTLYAVESFRALQPELVELTRHHWREIALDHDKVPLDPCWERYYDLEDRGVLCVVTAREDGRLVGYHITIVSPHLHYGSTLHGITDVYFVLPSHRKGFTGIRLLKEVEAEMKRRGVVKLITGTKRHLDLGVLFERLGYRETERVYTKIIGS